MNNEKTTGGIRLRLINYVTGGLALGIAILMLAATFMTFAGYRALKHTTDSFNECRIAAEDIQEASDFLTDQVRYFVGAGGDRFLEAYFEEANVTRRRENGLDVLGKYFSGTQLYTDLQNAVNGSKELMEVEYHAMRLKIESDGKQLSDYSPEIADALKKDEYYTAADRALSPEEQLDRSRVLVNDDAYIQRKDEISANVKGCLSGLEDNLQEKQTRQENRLRALIVFETVLIILTISMVALLVVLTSLKVFRPLAHAEKLIRNEEKLPEDSGSYEYRFFASTYNRMFEASCESREHLAFKASHDYLTGIFNRSGLDRYLDRAAAGRNALVLVDLDRFKKINDTYGHDGGDAVLRRLSEKLSNSFRFEDRICRIGGDEFAVIMWNVGVESGDMIREKIAAINAAMQNETDGVAAASISVGVAFGGEGTGRDLFRCADRELYRVKRSGGCGISIRSNSSDEPDDRDGFPEDEIEK